MAPSTAPIMTLYSRRVHGIKHLGQNRTQLSAVLIRQVRVRWSHFRTPRNSLVGIAGSRRHYAILHTRRWFGAAEGATRLRVPGSRVHRLRLLWCGRAALSALIVAQRRISAVLTVLLAPAVYLLSPRIVFRVQNFHLIYAENICISARARASVTVDRTFVVGRATGYFHAIFLLPCCKCTRGERPPPCRVETLSKNTSWNPIAYNRVALEAYKPMIDNQCSYVITFDGGRARARRSWTQIDAQ